VNGLRAALVIGASAAPWAHKKPTILGERMVGRREETRRRQYIAGAVADNNEFARAPDFLDVHG